MANREGKKLTKMEALSEIRSYNQKHKIKVAPDYVAGYIIGIDVIAYDNSLRDILNNSNVNTEEMSTFEMAELVEGVNVKEPLINLIYMTII